MTEALKRKYRLIKKLIKRYNDIPESQQKHRDIIKRKLKELKQEIQDLKRSNDGCVDRLEIIAQINALRATGRLIFTEPVDDKKYTTEELQHHLNCTKRKLKRGY